MKVHVDAGRSAARMDPEEASQLLIEEYNRMARAYDAYVAPHHAPIARHLLELGRVKAGGQILDIGCGTGIAAFEAATAGGWHEPHVTLTWPWDAVHLAAEKAAAQGVHQLRFEAMDSRVLPFPAESFDAVLSCFGHPIVGRDRCFTGVRRVLRPDGTFVLSTWNATKPSAMPFREILERRRPPVLDPDVARLVEARTVLASAEEGKQTQSADGWIHLLRNAGLSGVQVFEETHRAVFRGPDAYLDYSFAWGDNERELRGMTPKGRDSLREEFRDRVETVVTEEGLVVDWPLWYLVARA